MKLTNKDVAATVVTAAILVPYVGYVVRGSMPFIQDTRGMAGTGIVLLLAWGIFVREPFGRGAFAWVAGIVGLAALGLGVAAVWIESDVLLVPFMAAIVVLWAIRLLFCSDSTPIEAIGQHQPSHA
ncbi:MAG: hypothetical protein M3P01_08790 [Actinomycetota bacterium]|nr:hypothetical protein [Actinomycetota bacterium]